MKEQTMQELIHAVQAVVSDGCTVEARQVTKNNGTKLDAIIIREPDANIAPTIYINRMLQDIEDGTDTVENAAMCVLELHRNRQIGIPVEIGEMCKETVLERAVCSVVNKEKNAERLSYLTHSDFLDLAVIYRYPVGEDSFIMLTNQTIGHYGITPEELGRHATENTRRHGFHAESMSSVVANLTGQKGDLPDTSQDMPESYIITSRHGFGAAVLAVGEEFLEKLAEELDGDLFLLPSSIHEVIAVPAEGNDLDAFRDIVRDVNRTAVSAEDFLSDAVYCYSRGQGRVMSSADYEELMEGRAVLSCPGMS